VHKSLGQAIHGSHTQENMQQLKGDQQPVHERLGLNSFANFTERR